MNLSPLGFYYAYPFLGNYMKLFHQSYIGAISRIFKVCAERIHLFSRGVILDVRVRHGPTVPAANIVPSMPIYRDKVVSPSQRAISKICLSLMQIIFKVNSTSSTS